ncbi:MAG: type II and III secretion system protein [Candidatus Cloacimonadaceae bacterium]|nr:type II and III secretion system protein [Bacteroidales bacterium]
MKRIITVVLLFILIGSFTVKAQESDELLSPDSLLSELADRVPGLNVPLDLSAAEISLHDLLKLISKSHNVNFDLSPEINITIDNYYSNIPAGDFISYILKRYDLSMEIINNIIHIYQKNVPPPGINISFDPDDETLSYDLTSDSLYKVCKMLDQYSVFPIVVSPELMNEKVSAFGSGQSIEQALNSISIFNGFKMTTVDSIYLISNSIEEKQGMQNTNRYGYGNRNISNVMYNDSLFTIQSENVDVAVLFSKICNHSGYSLICSNNIKSSVSLYVKDLSFKALVDNVLSLTGIQYRMIDKTIILSNSELPYEEIIMNYQFKNRPSANIINVIPSALRENVEIIECGETNSVICFGDKASVDAILSVFEFHDKIIPMVTIEVIIVEYNRSKSISTGLTAGISNTPVETGGTILPLDMTINAGDINTILNSINGKIAMNLGNVSENFYLSLSALESQGVLNVQSTPKLSTINGVEAEMKIGSLEYYLEETSQIFANNTTTQTSTKQYKPVNADFILKITPYVSGGGFVNLNVSVEQSDFTGEKIAEDAPPNQISRSFVSSIRVKDQETILLGGLSKSSNSKNSSGIPFLARIPVIKWFFANQNNSRSKDELSVFIKPVISY